jgi:hypothetical protein
VLELNKSVHQCTSNQSRMHTDFSSGAYSVILAENVDDIENISVLTDHDDFGTNEEEDKYLLRQSRAYQAIQLEIDHKGCDTFSLDDEDSDSESHNNSFFSFTPNDEASDMLSSDGSSLTRDFLNIYSPFDSTCANRTEKVPFPGFVSTTFVCLKEKDRNQSIYDTNSVGYVPDKPLVLSPSLLYNEQMTSSGGVIVTPNLSTNLSRKSLKDQSEHVTDVGHEAFGCSSNLESDLATENKLGSPVGKIADFLPFAGWSCLVGSEDERSNVTDLASLGDRDEQRSLASVVFDNVLSIHNSEDNEQRQEGDCWMEDDCFDREGLGHEKLPRAPLHSIPWPKEMNYIIEESSYRNEFQVFGTTVSEGLNFEDSISQTDSHSMLLFSDQQDSLKPRKEYSTFQEPGKDHVML